MKLRLLSGGAAFGLIDGVKKSFESDNACQIQGEFGAVGFMKDKLLSGEPCDAIILSRKLIDQLAASATVDSNSIQNLGVVSTGIAVKSNQAKPAVATAAEFKQALLSADKIFVPNMSKSTAGLHMKHVFDSLGIYDAVRSKISEHPNGATAMKVMAGEPGNPIGCTQSTEILYTDGVQLIGHLPAGSELDTMYAIAIPKASTQIQLAGKLIAVLAADSLKEFKNANGFQI